MIRQAKPGELGAILDIYSTARAAMREQGNASQWGSSYPPQALVEEDIAGGHLYAVEREGVLCGVFYFAPGPDASYARIEEGAWPDDEVYAVIHRVASNGTARGVLGECLDYCKDCARRIRIDTHENNAAMRHLLEKHGFVYCGRVFMPDGSPRRGYQFTGGD